MIITIKVKFHTIWSADIELREETTLSDLHMAIQRAVRFDNDHLYAFYIARTEQARNQTRYECDEDSIDNTRLCELFPLPRWHKLFYLFDYGRTRIFQISKTRKTPHEPNPRVTYPRVVEETGKKPKQYGSYDD